MRRRPGTSRMPSAVFFKRFLTFSKNSGILRLLSKFDVSTKPITTAGMFAEHLWKGGRVVECTALERRHTEIPYRGFESLPFRQNTDPEASQAPGFFFICLEYQAHSRILLSSIPPKSARLRHITPCDRLWRWVFWWVFFSVGLWWVLRDSPPKGRYERSSHFEKFHDAATRPVLARRWVDASRAF